MRVRPIAVALALAVFSSGAVTYAQDSRPAVRPAALFGANLLANPGFESALPASLTTCGTLPASPGSWSLYSQNAGNFGARVASPVHAGGHALTYTTAVTGASCVGGGAYQDVHFTGGSYRFSVWVKPASGIQNVVILFGWDHAAGDVADDRFTVDPSSPNFTCWTTSTSVLPFSYAAWHKITLMADASNHVGYYFLDGKLGAETGVGAGPSAPFTTATIYLGHAAGASATTNGMTWDDVSFQSVAAPHLAAFSVKKTKSATTYSWSTAIGADLKGFNVYAKGKKVNTSLIHVHTKSAYTFTVHKSLAGPHAIHVVLTNGADEVTAVK